MGFEASRLAEKVETRFLDAAKGPGPIRAAVMIGNFPPRKCGIATYTRDTLASLRERLPGARWSLVAMTDGLQQYDFPEDVAYVIPQEDEAAYVRVADAINGSGAEIAFIQHEFGIFGGEAGSHLLRLMRRLRIPQIVTLHTILEEPDPAQKRVMDEILKLASAAIVMSETGADILHRVHNVGPSKVHVIPHGAPERPFASPDVCKAQIGLSGRKLLMTFGLLSPNKGIETVVKALPEIVQRHPDVLYLVVGTTHPNLLAQDGETYRDSVIELASLLGVEKNLRFINRFVDDNELVDLLRAADLYVTPYLTEAQITSGTLSYAVALGKPVVSTPYWHAREALADGVGVLCPFGDSSAFGRVIVDLLSDRVRREAMARRAYRAGVPSRWKKVAGETADLAASCREEHRRRQDQALRTLARPGHFALTRMTDDSGILQHSLYSVPDRRHGYCTDDNARALTLATRLAAEGENGEITRIADVASAFVTHAWNPQTGRFRNFMTFDRKWLDDGGSNDCCARALEALCVTARFAVTADRREWATGLVREAAPHIPGWCSMRARALIVKALIEGGAETIGADQARRLISENAQALIDAFLTRRHSGRDWFEPKLSYDNARLPEALILAGTHLEDRDMTSAGLSALDFIMQCQKAEHGGFSPIPTSSFDGTSAQHPKFDQQPIEALATVDACLAAWRATGHPRHAQAARDAFLWFGGQNDHDLALANPSDGSCHDGLTATGLNRNQGAESVLAYHLASAAMRGYLRRRSI